MTNVMSSMTLWFALLSYFATTAIGEVCNFNVACTTICNSSCSFDKGPSYPSTINSTIFIDSTIHNNSDLAYITDLGISVNISHTFRSEVELFLRYKTDTNPKI